MRKRYSDNKALPKQPFIALGIISAWLFFYVIFHEAMTASTIQTGNNRYPESAHAGGDYEYLGKLKDSVINGRKMMIKCQICHDLTAEKSRRYGPPLFGILGKKIASHEGYKYSNALKAVNTAQWTPAALWTFITEPKILGNTRMPFPGLTEPTDIRNVIHALSWSCEEQCDFSNHAIFSLSHSPSDEVKAANIQDGSCENIQKSPFTKKKWNEGELFLLPKSFCETGD